MIDRDATVFVGGARDPEMDRIEEVLAENEYDFVPATKRGERVNHGDDYDAEADIDPDRDVITIETSLRDITPVYVIDHHYEGDPGYDLPPELSWQASSIGQLSMLLAVEGTHADRVLAARDHNFAAAAMGEVPGVEPEEVIDLRVRELCAEFGIEYADALDVVDAFDEIIESQELVEIGNENVRDMRGVYFHNGYQMGLLAAQIAAAKRGEGVILRKQNDKQGGPQKVVLTGAVSAEQVKYFIAEWAPEHGLKDVFGVPSRSYAGGTEPLAS